MNRYTVNVHYDAVITVTVEASDEMEAMDKAKDSAACESLNEAEVTGSECCITDIEPC